jgi:hypothetical protein
MAEFSKYFTNYSIMYFYKRNIILEVNITGTSQLTDTFYIMHILHLHVGLHADV